MPAYNFKKQFAADVESGKKRCTIRRRRDNRPTRRGDHLALFCGMRTAQCRRLRDAVCESVQPIEIDAQGVVVNGNRLSRTGTLAIALADGFESPEEFIAFFKREYGLPTQDLEMITW